MQFIDYHQDWQQRVIELWQKCGLIRSWNDPEQDIFRKLTDTMGRFVLLLDDNKLIGSMMIGYDGHRGSVNYLAVQPDYQKQGAGRLMMDYCEDYLVTLGCPKINLCVRNTNVAVLDFYAALGYQADPVVVLGKRLIADK
ncbi:MAG: GNAT family acetyltransferase [Gammaproteobacteria bacterium]|jgi:ribosomal protein S18 acetylase RimI-like enzyme|nr:GNAT family acetyltransferase [Gammaproteobacteria bacterium]